MGADILQVFRKNFLHFEEHFFHQATDVHNKEKSCTERVDFFPHKQMNLCAKCIQSIKINMSIILTMHEIVSA